MKPTVSNIGAPTYQLSKYSAGLLSHVIRNSAHHVENSIQFVQILASPRLKPDDLTVSCSTVSLFTNKVPIVDSLELLSHHSEDDVLALLKHVVTSTYGTGIE
jgi:hypothetical protein